MFISADIGCTCPTPEGGWAARMRNMWKSVTPSSMNRYDVPLASGMSGGSKVKYGASEEPPETLISTVGVVGGGGIAGGAGGQPYRNSVPQGAVHWIPTPVSTASGFHSHGVTVPSWRYCA